MSLNLMVPIRIFFTRNFGFRSLEALYSFHFQVRITLPIFSFKQPACMNFQIAEISLERNRF